MSPFNASSGDLALDRRMQFVEMLLADKDFSAAREMLSEITEFHPKWPLGWFRLGEACIALSDIKCAAAAWERTLECDPSDVLGAGAMLDLHGLRIAEGQVAEAFVEKLFDGYADRFETSLVQKLQYNVPEQIHLALRSYAADQVFGSVLDMGCGTGLMGPYLRPIAKHLVGNDLSARMLGHARKKQIYDALNKENILTMAAPDQPLHDLITAADVLIYVGLLDTVFKWASRAIKDQGLFVFTVESHLGPEDFVLQPSRRYAHTRGYVEAQLVQNGFDISEVIDTSLRKDRGELVSGLLVIAKRRARGDVAVPDAAVIEAVQNSGAGRKGPINA